MEQPEVRYARSGEVNIAYQVTGRGPFDLVLVPGFISHLELDWRDVAGDGFFALFDGPARAIRCTLEVRNSLRELGLDMRAGVHTWRSRAFARRKAARNRE